MARDTLLSNRLKGCYKKKTDMKPKLSTSDPLEPSTDDYVGWTFTEDRVIFNLAVRFAKEWDAMSEPFSVRHAFRFHIAVNGE
jgi:hypothetical protein